MKTIQRDFANRVDKIREPNQLEIAMMRAGFFYRCKDKIIAAIFGRMP